MKAPLLCARDEDFVATEARRKYDELMGEHDKIAKCLSAYQKADVPFGFVLVLVRVRVPKNPLPNLRKRPRRRRARTLASKCNMGIHAFGCTYIC